MANKHLVFVYGTLKAGYGNHRLIQWARKVWQTVLPFLAMTWFGFPQVSFDITGTSNKKIIGEVYEIDDAQLANCDALEGHPSFYTRIEMPTDLGTVNVYNIQNRSIEPSPEYEAKFLVSKDEGTEIYEWSRA